jgi:PilZ domain
VDGLVGGNVIQRNKPLQPAKRRSVRRCPLVASAEVTELGSGAQLSARTSEVGLGGCYVDALNPFPKGTLVGLRILRDQGVFETKGKVVYCDPRFGMGLAFTEMTPDQRSFLEAWLAEIVSQLRPVS